MINFTKFINTISPLDRLNYLQYISPILDKQIEMYEVLNFYGIHVSPNDIEEQVPCKLPSHGSVDGNKSARYYKESYTNTSRVHCFKCQKTLSGFWYFYTIEKDADKKPIEILLDYLRLFKVDIKPEFYNYKTEIKKEEKNESIKDKILYFNTLRDSNFEKYVAEVKNYINENL